MNDTGLNSAASECPSPNGILLLIGGAEGKNGQGRPEEHDGKHLRNGTDILGTFVSLMDRDEPVVEVITSAGSDDGGATFAGYQKILRELGCAVVNQLHHNERPDLQSDVLRERLTAAHGVFFTGGDQLKLTALYGGTGIMKIIKERYIYDRLVVAGTSAGAMAMSTPMIYYGTGADQMTNGNVKITTGLEFMKDVCVDTHFVHRGRFVRMAQVIATNPACIGVGIEENTAILVRNGTKAEVIGDGVVIVIDGTESHGTNIMEFADHESLTIRGIRVDILSEGEIVEIPQMNPPHR